MTDTRNRMISGAARILQRDGYHAAGLRSIVTEAGASRGSIYHHFPGGKQQLTLEAIDYARRTLSGALCFASGTATTPADVIRSIARLLGRWLERSEYRDGCPVSTVLLERAPDDADLRSACRDAYREWTTIIANALASRGVEPAIANQNAILLVAAFEGALLLCRAEATLDPLDEVVAAVLPLVDSASG